MPSGVGRHVSLPRQPTAAPPPSSTAAADDAGSNSEADDTSSNNLAAPDVDGMLLANITADFLLPQEVATWIVGGMVLLKGVDSTIKSSMESLPEVSLLLYAVLLGAFSSMVCQIYWTESTRLTLWSELGPCLTLSGLFAQSMLLITPLLLLLPDQNAAEEFMVGAGLGSTQKAVTSCFQSSGLRRALLVLYLVLASFQVVSVYSFYRLAVLQEEALQDNQSVQVARGQEMASPYTTSLLYLLLAWCSVITSYEFLFDASFAADFPQNVLRRVAGVSTTVSLDNGGSDEDNGASGYQRFGVIRRGVQASAPYRTAADARQKFVEEGQKLIDNVKAIMPTSRWLQWAHLVLYQLFYLAVIVVIALMEVKMLRTAGISPLSVLFLVLTCALEIFVCTFGLFGCCGVKAQRVAYKPMPPPEPACVPEAYVEAEERRHNRTRPERHERLIEQEILSQFGDIVEAAFTRTLVEPEPCSVIIVPRRGQEEAAARQAGAIADLVSRMLMRPAPSPAVRIMSADEFSRINGGDDDLQPQDLKRSRAFDLWGTLAPLA